MTDPNFDFDNMTQADFEEHLPEFFANQTGSLTEDPRLAKFLDAHPDCAALVRDLESIANAAKALIDVEDQEPGEDLWARIEKEMAETPVQTQSGPVSVHGEPNRLITGGTLHDLE